MPALHWSKEEIRTETGRRIQASLDFIHDEDTRRAWARWSRCTISNRLKPSNRNSSSRAAWPPSAGSPPAWATKSKTPSTPSWFTWSCSRPSSATPARPPTRHLEVIDAEIHRLDRVVQTLVDFSRPVELQLREQDLRQVVGDVLALATRRALHPQRDAGQPHARRAR